MKKLQLTGAALAVGAAALFSVAPAMADDAPAAATAQVQCMGGNSCKGQSTCKTADNTCKGQNACKGKGVTMMDSADDCTKAGGKVVEDKTN